METARKRGRRRLKMLENMNRLLEKIDSLEKSFSNISPKKNHRPQQTFAGALSEATGQADSANAVTGNSFDIAKNLKADLDSLIARYSKDHGLQPEIVRQLIFVASGNNPQAVAPNGHLGLMAVNPAIFKDSGLQNPFDPEQNISAGTDHLAKMLQRNGGNLSLALAAYNTDPATVKRFGGVPPFADTQNFVGQILSGLGKSDK